MSKEHMKTAPMLAFERVSKDWGFDFEVEFNSEEDCLFYTDYATGTQYGMFLMGWDARESYYDDV